MFPCTHRNNSRNGYHAVESMEYVTKLSEFKLTLGANVDQNIDVESGGGMSDARGVIVLSRFKGHAGQEVENYPSVV
ncbi:hypothetical protein CEXT_429661 [Caerostris extrusa]|uniref:Uncharacterized protein n=1 Tax=Caerostris extrusa TaxID=172846 RepID=A0AAV4Q0H0_CAEEX|nr:hypothetical protein CEXT_429661 [Caerostris extrusa]